MDRRTRQGRQAGCHRSRSRQLGCQNSRNRKSRQDRCRCHKRPMRQCSRPHRRKCHPHRRRPHMDRRTRQGRQAGCHRSRNRLLGCRNIRSHRSRLDRCRCRRRRARQHMGQHRRRCRPCRRRPHKDLRILRGHRAGFHRSRNRLLGCRYQHRCRTRQAHCHCSRSRHQEFQCIHNRRRLLDHCTPRMHRMLQCMDRRRRRCRRRPRPHHKCHRIRPMHRRIDKNHRRTWQSRQNCTKWCQCIRMHFHRLPQRTIQHRRSGMFFGHRFQFQSLLLATLAR